MQTKKKLWRRKCIRRGIFRTVEVRVKEVIAPFNPYFLCNRAKGSLCDLGSSYTKNEYNLFYQKLDAEYYFIRQFFPKSSIFRKKQWKTALGHIWRLFREGRRLAPKINMAFYIINEVLYILIFSSFSKKNLYFLRKRQKTVSGALSKRRGVWRRK